jgi:hypothetical protein
VGGVARELEWTVGTVEWTASGVEGGVLNVSESGDVGGGISARFGALTKGHYVGHYVESRVRKEKLSGIRIVGRTPAVVQKILPLAWPGSSAVRENENKGLYNLRTALRMAQNGSTQEWTSSAHSVSTRSSPTQTPTRPHVPTPTRPNLSSIVFICNVSRATRHSLADMASY